jgi:hypothetical protein
MFFLMPIITFLLSCTRLFTDVTSQICQHIHHPRNLLVCDTVRPLTLLTLVRSSAMRVLA